MENWIHMNERLPENNVTVEVKVPNLSHFMMGINIFLPEGIYKAKMKTKQTCCLCSDIRHKKTHDRYRWSNNAGYWATHWRYLDEK
jgi:hypothetical protein